MIRHPGPGPGATILVVEDDAETRAALVRELTAGGYAVVEAPDGRTALDRWASRRPDLVLLDLGLPDMDGLRVVTAMRREAATPIVILSGRYEEQEKVDALDRGADDYVTKPFSTPELQARVRALLRRTSGEPAGGHRLEVGPLVMDLHTRTFTRQGEAIHLTPIEWDLLRVLMANAGRTLTHQHLFHEVWSGRAFGDAQQYLRVYVAHLRRKIGDDPIRPRYIVTEPGVGYRFSTDAEFSARR